jgi:hypothetical protein
MSRYLVVIEVEGQSGGRDDERERAAFEAALQRGYEKANRAGYSELRVIRFEKLDETSPDPSSAERRTGIESER